MMMKGRITTPEQKQLKGTTVVAPKRKFPLHYSYAKLGQKTVMFSSNMQNVSFTSQNSNGLADQLEYAYLNNVKKLMDNAFYGAVQLTSLSMNPNLEEIGLNCFDGCANLISVEIPNSVTVVYDCAFQNCRSLEMLGFEYFEYDSTSNSTPNLQSICQKLVANSSKVKDIVFPESITSLAQVDANALANSSVSSICFLGIASGVSNTPITSSHCFGLSSNCTIVSKDNCQYSFIGSTSTLEHATFKQYGSASIATGRANKLILGRKIYEFTEELYTWCVDPSQHDTSKFPSPCSCPLIIMYVDFKTSTISKRFLQRILQNSNFTKWCKENLKCYLFLLDRNGHITTGESSDLSFFRSLPYFSDGIDKDFVHLSFIYDGNFNQTAFIPGTLQDFEELVVEYAQKTKFGDFDSSQYESILDEPDPETIPTNGADGSSIKSFHSVFPDWFENGSIASSTAWSIASVPFDFDLVSTPETTYVLAGEYDANNPSNGPKGAVNDFTSCVELFADTVVKMYDTDCYSKYKAAFLKGKQYRYFIFYEASHGNTKEITIGIDYSEIWNMFSSMSSHQRVYGIFDSCHSGSMLQTSIDQTQQSDIDNNILNYLEYKFARRDTLLMALFGSTEAARSVNPKMILQSPTSASNYSYYQLGTNTCFILGYAPAYSSNKNKRFNEFWPIIKKECYVSDPRGDAEPQQMVYPSESGSFYKNKLFY